MRQRLKLEKSPDGCGKTLDTVEDWFDLFPPKRKEAQWKDGFSAKELAKYVLREKGCVPVEINEVISKVSNSKPIFNWKPECETNFAIHGLGKGQGRNHDLALWNDDIFVGVEAKVNESLGEYIGAEYEKGKTNKKHRIEGLIKIVFGDDLDLGKYNDIRYQLVTATAGTLFEAKNRNLDKAMVLVCMLKKDTDSSNSLAKTDMENFLVACNAELATDNIYEIPTYDDFSDIRLYFSMIEILIND